MEPVEKSRLDASLSELCDKLAKITSNLLKENFRLSKETHARLAELQLRFLVEGDNKNGEFLRQFEGHTELINRLLWDEFEKRQNFEKSQLEDVLDTVESSFQEAFMLNTKEMRGRVDMIREECTKKVEKSRSASYRQAKSAFTLDRALVRQQLAIHDREASQRLKDVENECATKVAEYKQRYDLVRSARDSLLVDIQELRRVIEDHQKGVVQMKEEIAGRDRMLEVTENRLEAKSKESDMLAVEVIELKGQLEDIRAQLAAKQRQSSRQQQQQQQHSPTPLQQQHSARDSSSMALNAELEQVKRKNTDSNRYANLLEDQLKELQQRCVEADTVKTRCDVAIAGLEGRVKELAGDLSASQGQVASLQSQLETVQKSCSLLRNRLRGAQRDAVTAKMRLVKTFRTLLRAQSDTEANGKGMLEAASREDSLFDSEGLSSALQALEGELGLFSSNTLLSAEQKASALHRLVKAEESDSATHWESEVRMSMQAEFDQKLKDELQKEHLRLRNRTEVVVAERKGKAQAAALRSQLADANKRLADSRTDLQSKTKEVGELKFALKEKDVAIAQLSVACTAFQRKLGELNLKGMDLEVRGASKGPGPLSVTVRGFKGKKVRRCSMGVPPESPEGLPPLEMQAKKVSRRRSMVSSRSSDSVGISRTPGNAKKSRKTPG